MKLKSNQLVSEEVNKALNRVKYLTSLTSRATSKWKSPATQRIKIIDESAELNN